MNKCRKVSIVNSSSSRNSLGRAYILEQVLSRTFQTEIVLPDFGKGVWYPLRKELEELKIAKGYYLPKFLFTTIPDMLREITGDVIYAIKPFPSSFGITLIKKVLSRKPLVIDIDDYEIGGYATGNFFPNFKKKVYSVRSPNGYPYLKMMYGLLHMADMITVSSTLLQKRFGGIIVPHGRDTDVFDPARFNREECRRNLNLKKTTILFLGTPRPHKGIEDLIEAIQIIHSNDLELLIVGANYSDPYTRIIKEKIKRFGRVIGEQSFNRIPEIVYAADIICVPQRYDAFSQVQVPAKIFDAMAMERIIISTKVSDIPQILNDCGVLAQPNNPYDLAEKIEWVLTHKDEVLQMRKRARRKCIKKFSYSAMEKILLPVFNKLI